MAWDLAPEALGNSLGSLPLIALGLWVALLRPRTRPNLAFGLLAMGFGVGWAFHWQLVEPDAPIAPLWFLASGLGFLAGAVGAAFLALWFPERLDPRQRRAIIVPLVAGSVYFAASVSTVLTRGITSAFPGLDPATGAATWLTLWSMAASLHAATWWATLLLLAERFQASGPEAGRDRRQFALMSAALLVWLVFRDAVFFGSSGYDAQSVAAAAVLALYAAVWLRNTRGPDGHLARNVVLLSLAIALAGRLWLLAAGDFASAVRSPVWGVLRVVGVGILAYAILRHSLLGLDVKVRWTISKTTLAGILVAGFFVVSETAQQFFGETFRSAYAGIIATALLVFATAPLSRVADRLAEKAVPISVPDTDRPATLEGREGRYRAVVARFMRDGVITVEEERTLAHLADDLGIPGGRAFELKVDVEATRRMRP